MIDARLHIAQADLEAARQHRNLRIAERRALDRARAEVTHQKAEVAMAEVAVAEAQLRLDRMEVRSPSWGIVMNRLVVPGSKLMLVVLVITAQSETSYYRKLVSFYKPVRLMVWITAVLIGIGVPLVWIGCQ